MIDNLIQLILTNPYPVTIEGYQLQLNAILQFDSSSWINEIKAPCLILDSDQDIITNREELQKIAKEMPDAHYHCFQGTAHLPHIEQPEEFNKVVLDFLQK